MALKNINCSSEIPKSLAGCSTVYTSRLDSVFFNPETKKVYRDKEMTEFIGWGEFDEEKNVLIIGTKVIQHLKRHIKEKGIKISWIAEQIDISQPLLSMQLNGKATLQEDTIEKVCELLSIDRDLVV